MITAVAICPCCGTEMSNFRRIPDTEDHEAVCRCGTRVLLLNRPEPAVEILVTALAEPLDTDPGSEAS